MMNQNPKLSVNINKVALVRNARGGNVPDLYQVALDCEAFGADGITVHPRPDERHIRYDDVLKLKELVQTEFNIEGYPSERFLEMVLAVQPDQCTLVPDPPGVLTSDTGWDTIAHEQFLKTIIGRLHEEGIRVSLFLNPEERYIKGAHQTGTDRIELYTGNFASKFHVDPEMAVAPFVDSAKYANTLGLGINAGHDLNLDNLKFFAKNIPSLLEVSIGHALISDALYFGLQNTISMYKRLLENA